MLARTVAAALLLLWSLTAVAVVDARLYHSLAGGLPVYDDFGDFVEYIIFAEENAPLTPVPKVEILNTELAEDRDIRQPMIERPIVPVSSPKFTKYGFRGNQSFSKTESDTIDIYASLSPTVQVPKTSFITWSVRSAPFGALSATGPKQFFADELSFFELEGLTFHTAGRYEVLFNVSMITGTNFMFNRTIFVQRQPNAVIHATVAAGYNGSAFFPVPSAQLVDFTGADVKTSTPIVDMLFEAVPVLSTVTGVLEVQADTDGFAEFNDIVPSLPGFYTFRLRATLSDGSTLTTASQRVEVERALPVEILIIQEMTGIARFQLFTQPIFSIRDSAGASQDTRQNMTLSIAQNSPSFSYEGYNTIATLDGNTSVYPVDYRYTYTDLSIDLPGSYVIQAALILTTGATLSLNIPLILGNPPTFEVFTSMVVNNPGIITLYGDRPSVDNVFLMLALDEACEQATSDQVVWPVDESSGEFNITVVPFNAATSYVCMSAAGSAFSPLIQRYLPQYDELFPLILTFAVADVDVCAPLTGTEAAQYKLAGWDSAAAERRYGCALTPPVAGTIPACECPAPLTCDTMTHESFTPANLNIGQCVCCETWVLVVAGCITGLFFTGVMAGIVMYV